MATYRTAVFPAINNMRAMNDVSKSVAKFFIDLFPIDFFKYIYVDTLEGIPSLYITKNGVLEMINEEVNQAEYPRLIIRVKPKANNIEETIFEKIVSIYKYPLAQLIRSDNALAFTFFDGDPYHIKISSMDDYTKSEIEFQIIVRSRTDQQAVANILATCCKKEYGYPFMVKTEYILPYDLTDHLKHCIFLKEKNAMIDVNGYMNEEEIKEVNKKINDQFVSYLNQYSYGDIVPLNPDESSNGRREFLLRRGLRIYLNIDNWEKDEGNKKENVYENFTLSANGYYECYHPLSFITTVPSIIRGQSNSKLIPTSNALDNNLNVRTMMAREAYCEERNFPLERHSLEGLWTKVFDEKEVVLDNKETETIDILDWVSENQFVSKTLELLVKNSTIDELRKNVKVFIYEDRDIIDDSRYYIDDGLVLVINNNDTEKCYYIELYINNAFMNRRLQTALLNEGV